MNINILNYLNEHYFNLWDYVTKFNSILFLLLVICFYLLYNDDELHYKRSKSLLKILSVVLVVSIIYSVYSIKKKEFKFVNTYMYTIDYSEYKEVLKNNLGKNKELLASNNKVNLTMKDKDNKYENIECVIIPNLITDSSRIDEEKKLLIEKYEKDENIDVFVINKIE